MDKTTLQNLTFENFSTRQIGEKLNLSQTAVRYWLNKFNLKTTPKILNGLKNGLLCQVCSTELNDMQSKFCSKKCSAKTTNTAAMQNERQMERKTKLVNLFGGACQECGYDKNYSALHFHHLDPDLKEFQLDSRKLANSSWEKILNEAKKCIILCANCHAEFHHPNYNKVDALGIEPKPRPYQG